MTSRRWGTCAVFGAVALLVLMPAVSDAQVRVGVGVQRGNVGFYAGPRAGYGFGYPGYGYGYPGFGYPGFGYPGFGYPRSGVSIGIGANPYLYPNYGYGYGAAPLYNNRYYTPFVPQYGYVPYSGGSSATYIVQPQVIVPAEPPMARVDNTAQLEIRVPANATVTFDGTEMKQTGPVRHFVSPELEPGYNYNYTIRATWMDNGQPVTQERKVVVRAGGKYPVDLTGEALSAPKTTRP